jgi:hypothetical protein
LILRRIVLHFRKQEWTAIALDFVIVVVGVFIGIQVANWNEAQADNRRGRDYTVRLMADLKKDHETRLGLTAYYRDVLESVERANALFADPDANENELVVHAYRASEINYAPPTRATWDEIVSSGDTGLLPDDAVRSSVADYFADDSARIVLESLSDTAYRHVVRTIIPLELQKAMRAGCSDIRNEAQEIVGFMSECKLDVDAEMIASTAAALRADPRVVQELRYQYSEIFSAHANISGELVFIERALEAIEALDLPDQEP